MMVDSTDLDLVYGLTIIAKSLKQICKDSYELHNVVERFILSNVVKGSFYDYTEETLDKFNSELADKNLIEYSKIILAAMSVRIPKPKSEPVIKGLNNNTLQYRTFKLKLSKQRAEYLSQYDIKQVILAAMKYYCLLPHGQQWAVPLEKYKEYVALGATVEGFASPFNSQMVLLGPYQYCSLFSTDRALGSIGNFFSADLSDKTIVVNPPFIESILTAAAEHCLQINSKVIFIGPWWEDSKFFQLLSKYPHVRLRPREHHYEDLFSGKKILAKFSSVEFMIRF